MATSPVQIGRLSSTPEKKKLLLTVVDKFFFVGVSAGIVGSAWLGVRLWLMLNGQLSILPEFAFLKHWHAAIQLYIFLGLFILGFSFHAVPRIMGSGIATPRWAPVFIVLPLIGLLLGYWRSDPLLASVLISFSFVVPALFVLRLCKTSSNHSRTGFGYPIAAGLLVMAGGAVSDISLPIFGLYVMWFGIGPIIFATSQQFISGFLKGRKLSPIMSVVHILLYFCSGAFAYLAISSPTFSNFDFDVFIAINLIISLAHYTLTGCYKGLLKLSAPIHFTFAVGFLWPIVANLMLLHGPAVSDFALHVLATGWAMTLVIGTSSNIISFMSTRPVLPPRILLGLLVAWQVVPLSRGFPVVAQIASWMPWLVSGVVVLVLGIWGAALVIAIGRLVRAQLMFVMK